MEEETEGYSAFFVKEVINYALYILKQIEVKTIFDQYVVKISFGAVS